MIYLRDNILLHHNDDNYMFLNNIFKNFFEKYSITKRTEFSIGKEEKIKFCLYNIFLTDGFK